MNDTGEDTALRAQQIRFILWRRFHASHASARRGFYSVYNSKSMNGIQSVQKIKRIHDEGVCGARC